MGNFWDRRDYTLDAPVTEVEHSYSEIQEETSLRVENKEEEKVGKKEEIKEKEVTISEERLNITNDALSNGILCLEEKEEEDVPKVYGLLNSTKKGQASTNAKKMRTSLS